MMIHLKQKLNIKNVYGLYTVLSSCISIAFAYQLRIQSIRGLYCLICISSQPHLSSISVNYLMPVKHLFNASLTERFIKHLQLILVIIICNYVFLQVVSIQNGINLRTVEILSEAVLTFSKVTTLIMMESEFSLRKVLTQYTFYKLKSVVIMILIRSVLF